MKFKILWIYCIAFLGVAAISGWSGGPLHASEGIDRGRIRLAVESGLKWLAENQIEAGHDAGRWEARYDVSGTAFGGLAFLAAGYLPDDPTYGPVIRRAVNYIKEQQDADGYVGGEHGSMYVHSICTLFVLSYLGMTEEPESEENIELAEWARRAVDLTLEAQRVRKSPAERGGWRYDPTSTDSDISHTTWQLQVLYAARQAGFDIPQEAFDDAMRYVNSGFMEMDDGAVGYPYRPGVVMDEPRPSSTGSALMLNRVIARQWDERLERASVQLRGFRPVWDAAAYRGYFYYGNFYVAQGIFHISEEAWKEYAPRLYRVLIENQEGGGYWRFPPNTTQQAVFAGRPYATGMSIIMLSMDNQYLPVLQRQN